ncbi:MAG TPA: hypothetical protein VGV07_02125 [Devosia sp.]|uniref:hypothetical protein n=1 Tax=Devosia sp. TaxID=1871048 RepID=UPI002DDCCDE2|nr:hypothetical protein [Devosia sp.]HEV2514020.1 hypothetical protein [Devosia sp.]
MKWTGAALGAIAVLLGGLWFLQGTGLVTLGPILCVAECEALEGPSLLWAVLGALLFAAGAAGVWFALFRRG